MRLVDANELKGHFPKDEDWDYPVNTNSRVVEIIDNAPTVDAVEVVRCEDCKFCRTWYFDKDGDYLWAICTFWNEGSRVDGIDVYKNGFCSNGKRRIDDETG